MGNSLFFYLVNTRSGLLAGIRGSVWVLKIIIIIIIIIIIPCKFFTPALALASHWSLSESKSPQVSRTLLSILANLNNAVMNQLIGLVVDCSPMARGTGVQSQVELYQRLKKWYLIPPCLTLSIIRYVSRVNWRNPGKGVVPSPTPQCSSYWKGSFRVALDYGRQLYFNYLNFLHSFSNFQLFHAPYKVFWDHSKCANYNWYHHHFYIP